jgi:hypothetical protein
MCTVAFGGGSSGIPGYGLPFAPGDGPHPVPGFRRVNERHPRLHASVVIFPHGARAGVVSAHIDAAAHRAGLEVVRNWDYAGADQSIDGLVFDPWSLWLKAKPPGSYEQATGQTDGRVKLWAFMTKPPTLFDSRFWTAKRAPEGLNTYLALSAVTWRFTETGDSASSLIAQCYGFPGKRPDHDAFLLKVAAQVLQEVAARIEKQNPPSLEAVALRRSKA